MPLTAIRPLIRTAAVSSDWLSVVSVLHLALAMQGPGSVGQKKTGRGIKSWPIGCCEAANGPVSSAANRRQAPGWRAGTCPMWTRTWIPAARARRCRVRGRGAFRAADRRPPPARRRPSAVRRRRRPRRSAVCQPAARRGVPRSRPRSPCECPAGRAGKAGTGRRPARLIPWRNSSSVLRTNERSAFRLCLLPGDTISSTATTCPRRCWITIRFALAA